MDRKTALSVIHNQSADLGSRLDAASALMSDPTASLDDLILCLDGGGLPAELVALELYKRTKRPSPLHPLDVSLKAEEWRRYLGRG